MALHSIPNMNEPKLVLIGVNRKTGNVETICKDASAVEQLEAYQKISKSTVNGEWESAGLVNFDNAHVAKKLLRFSIPLGESLTDKSPAKTKKQKKESTK